MQLEQAQEAIRPYLPEIITGAASTFSTALIFGGGAFVWWLVKRRIEKKEALEEKEDEKEEERGPVLYKTEHDESCGEVQDEHLTKMDELLEAVNDSSKEAKDFRKEMKQEIGTVHVRIDQGNQIMVEHLQAELNRKAG